MVLVKFPHGDCVDSADFIRRGHDGNMAQTHGADKLGNNY